MLIEECETTLVPIFTKEMKSFIHDVYITGAIESGTNAYVDLLDKLRFANSNEIFRIYLNCEGGCFYTTMQIMNAMIGSDAQIVTIADGMVASAASMIFLCGDELEVNENAAMLIHCPSYELGGKGHDVIKHARFNDILSKQTIEKIYSGFLTSDEISQVINGQDFWIFPDEICERLVKFVKFREEQFEEAEKKLKDAEEEELERLKQEEEFVEKRPRGKKDKIKDKNL